MLALFRQRPVVLSGNFYVTVVLAGGRVASGNEVMVAYADSRHDGPRVTG